MYVGQVTDILLVQERLLGHLNQIQWNQIQALQLNQIQACNGSWLMLAHQHLCTSAGCSQALWLRHAIPDSVN